jgi:hypothetical protein
MTIKGFCSGVNRQAGVKTGTLSQGVPQNLIVSPIKQKMATLIKKAAS